MLIATDQLSIVFISCFLFGLLFLIVTTLLGNLGHSGQSGHAGHIGHSDFSHHVDALHPVPHVVNHQVGVLQGKAIHVGNSTHPVSQGTTTHNGTQATQQGNSFSLFGYVNPTSLVLFLLGFGFFGYVFHNITALALPLTLILAAISGLIVAGLLLALLGRVFGDSEGATVQDVSDRTGMLGKVSVTIQENGLGEVLYISPGGMRKSIPARSVDGRRLERAEEVVVVNYQRGVAEVDTWEHFISQDQPTSAATPDNDNVDLAHADELAELRALLEENDKTDSSLVMRKDFQKE